MRKRVLRRLLIPTCCPILLQVGCLNPADFRAIAEGQFISFVNALINSVTSDLLRTAIDGG